MDRQHPHFGASYKIAERADGSFGVEVTIPDTHPVNVTGFGTQELAGEWVAKHKDQVASGAARPQRWRRAAGKR